MLENSRARHEAWGVDLAERVASRFWNFPGMEGHHWLAKGLARKGIGSQRDWLATGLARAGRPLSPLWERLAPWNPLDRRPRRYTDV
jgi:hypothetical protein